AYRRGGDSLPGRKAERRNREAGGDRLTDAIFWEKCREKWRDYRRGAQRGWRTFARRVRTQRPARRADAASRSPRQRPDLSHHQFQSTVTRGYSVGIPEDDRAASRWRAAAIHHRPSGIFRPRL